MALQFPSPSSSNQPWRLPETLLLLLLLSAGVTSRELLKNSDFESPPSNLPENSNKTSVKLNENSTIPGWTFQGTGEYITVSQNISLPEKGHAILLGEDGRINQTFIADVDFLNYLLTFALAPGGQNCSSTAPLLVSAPDSDAMFTFSQHYGKEPWEVHGVFLGSWGDEEPVNLQIGSQANDSTPACWPVIDSLHIKTMGIVMPDSGNLVVNGGFEFGPDFLESVEGGVLLDSVPTPLFSPLAQWAIMGTVRYINSKHFFVPQGNAAVELISGASSGVQAAVKLQAGSYTLNFTLGDANDSCEAKFLVGVQAGSGSQNFTLESNGTGSAVKFSMPFNAAPDDNTITFLSYTTSKTKDGDFCGPVIDDVFLRASHGLRILMPWKTLIPLRLITILFLL
ncbi:uncharacterized protein LOC111435121 [Cucurbita moschata]|uniref:Uncharacterized protein LOC111435121 n=1 Tax=Cucurbita moschata TaxID=3662 RepID=A0A6J1EJB2_CUCMO|nr:uncharacterized protein LOC111435121 [Cucurbita moschata]